MRNEPEGFEEFWIFWRKTCRQSDGRGKCRKQYQDQLKNGATPEDILLAAHNHIRNTKDLAYVPLASSWLNSEKWMDEAPKEREAIAYQERLSQAQQPAQNVVSMPPRIVLPPHHFLNQKKQQA